MPRRLSALLAAVAAVVALATVPPALAAACDCSNISGDEATAAADLVFTGAAVDQRAGANGADAVQFLFAVEEVRKGPTLASAVVSTSRDGASCGAGFAVNTRWLVYAERGANGSYSTTLCAGNELLSDSADLPSGAAEWPDQAEQAAQGDANPALPLQSFVMILVVLVLAVGSAVAFVWRGRGARRRSSAG